MNKISKSVDIQMDNKDYKIRFTIGKIEELEGKTGKSAMDFIQNPQNISITDLVTALWVGIKTSANKPTRDEVKNLITKYIDDGNNATTIINKVYAAMGLSGLFGDVNIFKDMLKENQIQEDDDEGK